MARGLLTRTGLLLGVALLSGGAWGAHDVTFAERVAAERAIARIYHAHQLGAPRPFEETVPPIALEQSVRRSLAESAALESLWGVRIDGDALRTELRRIARDTRFPDRLREVYDALGNDAVLVQETFVRRTLADRLARRSFARDPRIHATTRREAESLRARLIDGTLPIGTDDPRRHVTELVLRASDREIGSTRRDEIEILGERRVRIAAAGDEFAQLRAGAPARVGEAGPIVEDDEAFVVRVALADAPDRATLASWVVPKISWNAWWDETGPSFESRDVRTVAGPSATLPETHGVGSPPTCSPSDTWDNGGLGAVPDGRSSARAVWTGSEMVVWGGYRDGVYPVGGGRYDPVTDTWSRTSPLGAPAGRTGHTAVWTGSRLAIWGGFAPGGQLSSGALYDPVADSWTAIANVGAPGPRQDHAAIWTGSAMLVWGGYFADISGGQWLQTGGRYDPASNSWQPTTVANAPAGRQYHSAGWTGAEMIVWGGRISGSGSVLQTGGRYDPVANTWAPMTASAAPTARELHTAVWSGDEMLVWGGQDYVAGTPRAFNTGGRYDPVNDLWMPMTAAGAPAARRDHTAVWTGDEMLVWGGDAAGNYFGNGGRYRPTANAWASIPMTGAPPPRTKHVAVWSGKEMIVWTGYSSGSIYHASGGRYDPARDLWTPTFWANPPKARHGATAVWTGTVWIVWGGINGEEPLNSGSRYDPLTDTWSPTAPTGNTRLRIFHTAVWTGSEMLVWGGEPCPFPQDFGGRYDPLADTWQPIDHLTEPLPRRRHAAVWTGSRMLVWGGLTCESDTSVTDSGALYDPVANSWTPINSTGAPTPRQEHTALWTGSEMLVWGGRDGDAVPRYTNTGGRFDPASGVWTGIAKGGAPSARARHTAVWTGSTMIVWGGTGGGDFNTGAVYDPAANNWSGVAVAGAPSARIGHTAVWTGNALPVWGGETSASGFDALANGRVYHPASNSWTPMTFVDVPSARHDHVAAWLGSFMATWGGRGDYEHDSGGRYVIDNPDGDADGVANICDCAPSNPSAFYVPSAVTGLRIGADKTTVSWTSAAPGSGAATVHDLVRGRLDELPVGSGGSEACLASGIAGSSVQDASSPPSTDGFWYLVRGKNGCGIGTYGYGSGGAEEITAACP